VPFWRSEKTPGVIVFGLGSTSSSIPGEWAAEENGPGLFLLECMKEDPVKILADNVTAIRRPRPRHGSDSLRE
jgi:hypothetical protein